MTPASWLPVHERRERRRVPHGLLLLPLAFVSVLMLLIAGLFVQEVAWDAWVAWGFGLAGAGGLTIYRLAVRRDRWYRELAIRSEEAPMLPELGVREGVLVALWVTQGEAVSGYDRGAIWVEEGRLTFCGRHTSFVLAREDAVERTRGGPGQIALRLRAETPVGPLGVAFTPLFGDRPYVRPLEATVGEWLADAPWNGGPSQFPPVVTGPNVPTTRGLIRQLAGRAAKEAGFVGLLLMPFAFHYGRGDLLALVVLWLFLVGFVRPRAWRAIRDQGALEGRG